MKILFICHGNICRSPMALYIMNHILKENNDSSIICSSKATSFEEIGNDIYPPVKRILLNNNIKCDNHHASHLEKSDCDNYDLLICMDDRNVSNVKRIAGNENINKIHKLLEFSNLDKDVLDPWYTRDFISCYNEISKACLDLYHYLKK